VLFRNRKSPFGNWGKNFKSVVSLLRLLKKGVIDVVLPVNSIIFAIIPHFSLSWTCFS